HLERSVPFGKYCLRSPFVFSFVPRCHGDCGSAKNTGIPVSTRNCACADISFPRSHVKDLTSSSGSVDIALASAFFIVIAPYPANAGPFFGVSLCRYPSSLGRCTSFVYLVVRSTTVPIA